MKIRIKNFGHAGMGICMYNVLKDCMDESMWKSKLKETFDCMYKNCIMAIVV